jgi:hypothetical protein
MKFMIGIVSGVLLGSIIRFSMLESIRGRPVPTTVGLATGFKIKENLANHVLKPKILFVGGSSVDMGISAQQATQALGISCINYGIMVPMGLKYILHLAKKALTAGDTVVLALEYDLLDWPGDNATWLDPMYVRYVSSCDDAYVQSLTSLDQAMVLLSVTDSQMMDAWFRSSRNESSRISHAHQSFRNAFGDRTDNTVKAIGIFLLRF